jgi:cation transport regulator ChaC
VGKYKMAFSFRRGIRRIWIPVAAQIWPLARIWYHCWGLTLNGHPEDSVWYFAFGANMHDSVFRTRRGMRPNEWRTGRIKGYRLRFNLDGHPKGKAAPANISPDENMEVWGVLYRLKRRTLIRLNASEGVPGRRYCPVWLNVEDGNGNPLQAIAYIADGNEKDGVPSLRYLTLLREGASAHGLPEKWIAYLADVRHV